MPSKEVRGGGLKSLAIDSEVKIQPRQCQVVNDGPLPCQKWPPKLLEKKNYHKKREKVGLK